jgi:hypothetical protein
MMKVGFHTSLVTELKEGCDNIWIVTAPLKYWSDLLNCLIVIPTWYEIESEPESAKDREARFYTDFASVPRVPIFYEMWGNRAHREAVLHDYLYRIDSKPVVARSQADSVFLEAMKSTGKSWYLRWPMYLGVVIGGAGGYHKRVVGEIL